MLWLPSHIPRPTRLSRNAARRQAKHKDRKRVSPLSMALPHEATQSHGLQPARWEAEDRHGRHGHIEAAGKSNLDVQAGHANPSVLPKVSQGFEGERTVQLSTIRRARFFRRCLRRANLKVGFFVRALKALRLWRCATVARANKLIAKKSKLAFLAFANQKVGTKANHCGDPRGRSHSLSRPFKRQKPSDTPKEARQGRNRSASLHKAIQGARKISTGTFKLFASRRSRPEYITPYVVPSVQSIFICNACGGEAGEDVCRHCSSSNIINPSIEASAVQKASIAKPEDAAEVFSSPRLPTPLDVSSHSSSHSARLYDEASDHTAEEAVKEQRRKRLEALFSCPSACNSAYTLNAVSENDAASLYDVAPGQPSQRASPFSNSAASGVFDHVTSPLAHRSSNGSIICLNAAVPPSPAPSSRFGIAQGLSTSSSLSDLWRDGSHNLTHQSVERPSALRITPQRYPDIFDLAIPSDDSSVTTEGSMDSPTSSDSSCSTSIFDSNSSSSRSSDLTGLTTPDTTAEVGEDVSEKDSGSRTIFTLFGYPVDPVQAPQILRQAGRRTLQHDIRSIGPWPDSGEEVPRYHSGPQALESRVDRRMTSRRQGRLMSPIHLAQTVVGREVCPSTPCKQPSGQQRAPFETPVNRSSGSPTSPAVSPDETSLSPPSYLLTPQLVARQRQPDFSTDVFSDAPRVEKSVVAENFLSLKDGADISSDWAATFLHLISSPLAKVKSDANKRRGIMTASTPPPIYMGAISTPAKLSRWRGISRVSKNATQFSRSQAKISALRYDMSTLDEQDIKRCSECAFASPFCATAAILEDYLHRNSRSSSKSLDIEEDYNAAGVFCHSPESIRSSPSREHIHSEVEDDPFSWEPLLSSAETSFESNADSSADAYSFSFSTSGAIILESADEVIDSADVEAV